MVLTKITFKSSTKPIIKIYAIFPFCYFTSEISAKKTKSDFSHKTIIKINVSLLAFMSKKKTK